MEDNGRNIQANIVFFDGVCSICNTSIDFLMKIDKNKSLRFASLQGKTAKKLLAEEYILNPQTLVFLKGEEVYTESTGVIKILHAIGGIWKFGAVFYAIPKFIRDRIYSLIAKNRYKWFGKRETCRMPTVEERNRVLD